MTNPGDARDSAPNDAPVGAPGDAPIDAEIVDLPAAPVAPTRADVTGYTEGGVPTFDHVREVIERRTATAIGGEELAHGTAAGQDAERAFAEREKAAKAKLDEIRASLRASSPEKD
ncbi:hypothetical protein [Tsukamurella strandjordii]|uniref:PspA domain-containing protein n=1 Tax=Tsukamurella strandjordii TaxID=147577 RepID=A0AA90N9B7_9ACTN|nr:hypothetical protein [Tsukamurella strandjordii]MDP0397413.1 hypothetical protein [Tsukamurella strandjordii]